MTSLINRLPLDYFPEWKEQKESRIMGTEHELGAPLPEETDPTQFWKVRLPGFLIENGGRIYPDVEHPEICTPECSSPFELLAWEKGMEAFMRGKKYTPHGLYKHTYDAWADTSFGMHLNMAMIAQKRRENIIQLLVPFFITQQCVTGAGGIDPYFQDRGDPREIQLVLSQKSAKDDSETKSQGIKGERVELAHYDANMSHRAIVLKAGSVDLLLSSLERGYKLPFEDEVISCSSAPLIWKKDAQRISFGGVNKEVRSLESEPTALQIQEAYYEHAEKNYRGASAGIDLVLDLWQDTLSHLRTCPENLFGKLDWVTKNYLLRRFEETIGDHPDKAIWFMSQEMEYHNIDRRRGLHYLLERRGQTEKIVTNRLIGHTVRNPPITTRAWARGKIMQRMMLSPKREGINDHIDWEGIKASGDYFDMGKPHETYANTIDDIVAALVSELEETLKKP